MTCVTTPTVTAANTEASKQAQERTKKQASNLINHQTNNPSNQLSKRQFYVVIIIYARLIRDHCQSYRTLSRW